MSAKIGGMMNESNAHQCTHRPRVQGITDEKFEEYWARVQSVPGLEERLQAGEPNAFKEYFELEPGVSVTSVEVTRRTEAPQQPL